MKTIINLISNAAEAMPQGGILTIQSYNCFLDNPVNNYETIPAGTYSVLSVKDSGGGIPDKDLLKIFEPFYTKKQMGRSGTGLGMTVIWGTVKDHHGFIDVNSVEGQGTTFSIYFPITEKQSDKRELRIPQNTIAEYKGNGELILVVDDIEDQRKIAKDLLSVLGYSVITASDGEKAVEYLKERNPDLVLLDMIMAPGIDGLDTYKKILKCNPRQKTLIVSGYAENERIKETIRLGAGKYLKKPYTLNVLGNAIKEELRF
jgi:CheY-like chemotaxis protein